MELTNRSQIQPGSMTPVEFFQILKRRKRSLILPALLVFLAAAVVALILPPIYKSTSTILIEEQEVPEEFVRSTVTGYAQERVQTINQRIMSYTRLLDIINQLNLYQELRERLTTEQIVERMRERIHLEPVSVDVRDRRTGRPGKATIAFALSYDGKNPETVQRVTTVLTNLFLKENLQVRERQTLETTKFIEDEMKKVQADLTQLDSRLSKFKAQHINELPELLQVNQQSLQNIEARIDRSLEQLRNLKEKKAYLQTQLVNISPYLGQVEKERLKELKLQLADLKSRVTDQHPDLVQVRSEIAQIKKTYREIQQAGASRHLGQDEKERLKELKLQLVDLKSRVTDQHPELMQLRAEIAQIENEQGLGQDVSGTIDDPPDNPAYITLTSQLAGIQSDLESVRRQMQEFQELENAYRKRIEATPRVEEVYRGLTLQQQNLQAKYTDLMNKLMEARVAHGLEKEQKGERFTLIEPARLPQKPYKPNRLVILLIGVVLGIGAGAGTASLREFMDSTVRDPGTLAFALAAPVLAAIPEIRTKRDLIRRRIKRVVLATLVLCIILGGLAAFHYLVTDMNVVWARMMQRITL